MDMIKSCHGHTGQVLEASHTVLCLRATQHNNPQSHHDTKHTKHGAGRRRHRAAAPFPLVQYSHGTEYKHSTGARLGLC